MRQGIVSVPASNRKGRMGTPHFNEIGDVTDDILEVQDNEPRIHVVFLDEAGADAGEMTIPMLHNALFDIFGS